jgi:esterase
MDRFATLNGLRANYVEWGDPQAPPVILLHGLRSYARTWEPVAAALADRYRLIALDHRGRGDSDWDPAGDYFTETYVSDLEQFADTLALPRFALIGHSMGGANAIVYAARHPERVRLAVIEDIGPGSSARSGGAERIRRELAETPARSPRWGQRTPTGVACAPASRTRRSARGCGTPCAGTPADAGCGSSTWRASSGPG